MFSLLNLQFCKAEEHTWKIPQFCYDIMHMAILLGFDEQISLLHFGQVKAPVLLAQMPLELFKWPHVLWLPKIV